MNHFVSHEPFFKKNKRIGSALTPEKLSVIYLCVFTLREEEVEEQHDGLLHREQKYSHMCASNCN